MVCLPPKLRKSEPDCSGKPLARVHTDEQSVHSLAECRVSLTSPSSVSSLLQEKFLQCTLHMYDFTYSFSKRLKPSSLSNSFQRRRLGSCALEQASLPYLPTRSCIPGRYGGFWATPHLLLPPEKLGGNLGAVERLQK